MDVKKEDMWKILRLKDDHNMSEHKSRFICIYKKNDHNVTAALVLGPLMELALKERVSSNLNLCLAVCLSGLLHRWPM